MIGTRESGLHRQGATQLAGLNPPEDLVVDDVWVFSVLLKEKQDLSLGRITPISNIIGDARSVSVSVTDTGPPGGSPWLQTRSKHNGLLNSIQQVG